MKEMQQKSGIFGHQSHFPPSFTTSSSSFPVYTFSLLLLSVQLFLMDEGNGERKGKGEKRYFSLLLFPPSESARMAFGEKGVEGEGERERRKHYWQILGVGGEEKRRGKGFGWWVLALFLSLSLSFLPTQPCEYCWKMEIRSLSIGPLFGAKRNSKMKKGDGIILVLGQNSTGTRNTPLSAIEFF